MTPRRRRGQKDDVDRLVEEVIAGNRIPDGRLDDPADVDALRAAIELRAARPGTDLPAGEFVTELRRRLTDEQVAEDESHNPRLARRALLAGAGAIAAGFVGVVADRALIAPTSAPSHVADAEMVPNDGVWVAIGPASDVVNGKARPFATAAVVGFVTRDNGKLSAVAGACTHQGCLLKLNEDAGRLDCPCHRTSFGFDGKLLFYQLASPPAPLPQVQVRTRDGNVEAFVPQV